MTTLQEILSPSRKMVRTVLTLTTANTAYLAPTTELNNRNVIYVYNNNASAILYWGGPGVTGASDGVPINPGAKEVFAIETGLYLVSPTASATAIITEML
jgi:hypothetical protein